MNHPIRPPDGMKSQFFPGIVVLPGVPSSPGEYSDFPRFLHRKG